MSSYPEQTQELKDIEQADRADRSATDSYASTEPLARIQQLESLLDQAADPRLEATQALPGGPQQQVDDEEVAQYMASLMERYGIRDDAPEAPPVTAPAVTAPPVTAPIACPCPEESASEPPATDATDSQENVLRQPAKPPELAADMGSLRELANETARSAVNVHLGSQIVAAAYTKLILAIVAVMSSAICAVSSPTVASPFYFVSVGAGLASVYWVAQFWRLSGELHALVTDKPVTPAPKPTR